MSCSGMVGYHYFGGPCCLCLQSGVGLGSGHRYMTARGGRIPFGAVGSTSKIVSFLGPLPGVQEVVVSFWPIGSEGG
jgi:hypothetical protein